MEEDSKTVTLMSRTSFVAEIMLILMGLSVISIVGVKYLENGTILFQPACVEIYQTLASVTYIKSSQIGDHQSSSFCGSRSWLMWNGS